LPLWGHFGVLVKLFQQESRLPQIIEMMSHMSREQAGNQTVTTFLSMLPEAMEGMIRDGWLQATYDPKLPLAQIKQGGTGFHLNKDTRA